MSHSFTEALAGGNGAIGKAGFAAGTTTTTTTAAFAYMIEGIQYTKAAAANAATPTLDGATNKAFRAVNPGQACNFVFGVDKTGAIAVWQGERVDAGTPADWPAIPFTHAVYGVLRVDSAASNGVAFTLGASNMAGLTGVTYKFSDIVGQSARPLKAA